MIVLCGYSQKPPSDSTLSPVASYMVHGDTAYCFTDKQVSNLAYHVRRSQDVDSIIARNQRLTNSYEEQINTLKKQKGNCYERLSVKDSINTYKDKIIHRKDTVIQRKNLSIDSLQKNNKLFKWVAAGGWVAFIVALL